MFPGMGWSLAVPQQWVDFGQIGSSNIVQRTFAATSLAAPFSFFISSVQGGFGQLNAVLVVSMTASPAEGASDVSKAWAESAKIAI